MIHKQQSLPIKVTVQNLTTCKTERHLVFDDQRGNNAAPTIKARSMRTKQKSPENCFATHRKVKIQLQHKL